MPAVYRSQHCLWSMYTPQWGCVREAWIVCRFNGYGILPFSLTMALSYHGVHRTVCALLMKRCVATQCLFLEMYRMLISSQKCSRVKAYYTDSIIMSQCIVCGFNSYGAFKYENSPIWELLVWRCVARSVCLKACHMLMFFTTGRH